MISPPGRDGATTRLNCEAARNVMSQRPNGPAPKSPISSRASVVLAGRPYRPPRTPSIIAARPTHLLHCLVMRVIRSSSSSRPASRCPRRIAARQPKSLRRGELRARRARVPHVLDRRDRSANRRGRRRRHDARAMRRATASRGFAPASARSPRRPTRAPNTGRSCSTRWRKARSPRERSSARSPPTRRRSRARSASSRVNGKSAQHTGTSNSPWAGGRAGKNYVTQGNLLVGPEVLEAVARIVRGERRHAPSSRRPAHRRDRRRPREGRRRAERAHAVGRGRSSPMRGQAVPAARTASRRTSTSARTRSQSPSCDASTTRSRRRWASGSWSSSPATTSGSSR